MQFYNNNFAAITNLRQSVFSAVISYLYIKSVHPDCICLQLTRNEIVDYMIGQPCVPDSCAIKSAYNA